MSLWDKFAVWRNAGSSGAGESKRLYIVDAASLSSTNGGRARLAPRDQLDMLSRLSRFSKKEGIKIHTVFEGKELRKVPDNTEYKDVMVRFAGKASDLPPLVVKLAKDLSKKYDVVVITSDKELENQVLAVGATTIRSSTFSKGMDAAIGSGEGDRSSGGSRRRRPRRGGRKSGGSRPPRQKKKSQSKKDDGLDSVRELIDLVEEEPGHEPNGNIVKEEEEIPDEKLDDVVDGNR